MDVAITEQALPEYPSWGEELREFLTEFRNADLQMRMSSDKE